MLFCVFNYGETVEARACTFSIWSYFCVIIECISNDISIRICTVIALRLHIFFYKSITFCGSMKNIVVVIYIF